MKRAMLSALALVVVGCHGDTMPKEVAAYNSALDEITHEWEAASSMNDAFTPGAVVRGEADKAFAAQDKTIEGVRRRVRDAIEMRKKLITNSSFAERYRFAGYCDASSLPCLSFKEKSLRDAEPIK